jgi:hypothetical protein
MLLHGNAAVTIDCLVRSSPEGQRRLFKQYVGLFVCLLSYNPFVFIRCRVHTHNLDILQKYITVSSPFKTKIDELCSAMHEQLHFPAIQPKRQRRSVPTV